MRARASPATQERGDLEIWLLLGFQVEDVAWIVDNGIARRFLLQERVKLGIVYQGNVVS